MRSTVWIALAVAACGPAATAPPARPAEPSRSIERSDEARRGALRDERAAAERSRVACDEGRGDVAACGALVRAQVRARGVALDLAATRALATVMCVERRDPFGCVVLNLLSQAEPSVPAATKAAIQEASANHAACDADHMSECYAEAWGGILEHPAGSTAERRKRAAQQRRWCELGIVEGCVQLVRAGEGDRPGQYGEVAYPSNDVAPRAADDEERELAREQDDDAAAAERQLQKLCDAGDADACEEAPGRAAFSLEQRCQAGHYEACLYVGCRGDQVAAAAARDHGVRSACAPPSPSRGERDAAKEYFRLSVDMCACTDDACRAAVRAKVAALPASEHLAAAQAKDSGCGAAASPPAR